MQYEDRINKNTTIFFTIKQRRSKPKPIFKEITGNKKVKTFL